MKSMGAHGIRIWIVLSHGVGMLFFLGSRPAMLPSAAAGIPEPGSLVVWLPAANGAVPPNAIIGGSEPGRTLPVCRAIYNKGVHPGKVVGKNCNFGYGGLEVLSPQYAVLVVGPVLPPTPVSQPQVGKVDIAISNTKASLIALQAEQFKGAKQSGFKADLASSIDKSVLGISNAEKLNNLAREIASQISQQAASESPSTAADAKATQSLTAAQEAELLNLNSRMMEIIREVLRLRQSLYWTPQF